MSAGMGKIALIGAIIGLSMLALIFIPSIFIPASNTADLNKYLNSSENGSAATTIKVVQGTSSLSAMGYSIGLPTVIMVLGLFVMVIIVYAIAKKLMRKKK